MLLVLNCMRMSVANFVRIFSIALVFCINFKSTKQEFSPESVEWTKLQYAAQVLQRSRRQVASGDSSPDLPSGDIPQYAACGINGKSKNLIDVVDSSPGVDWPWIVGIVYKEMNPPEAFCGGALLNRNYVLTAAHCFGKFNKTEIYVRVGEYDFEVNNETKFVDFKVEKIIIHQLYDAVLHKNDVALLKLGGLIQYSAYTRPICLPPAGYQVQINQTAFIAGWGQTAFGEITSLTLLHVSVPVWNLSICKENYGAKVFDENICASGYEGDKDSCVGDSGGPLISQLPSGRWIQIGVVSWGMNCGDAKKPGVYASVSYFLDWIRKNMLDAVI